MCNERREGLQVIDMGGDTPSKVVSINISSWRFWFWLGGRIAAVILVGWAVMTFTAEHVFEQQLDIFHQEVKPGVIEAMEKAVNDHASIPAHPGVIERITEREVHDAGVDGQLQAIQTNQNDFKQNFRDVNRKLDIIIRNGDHE